MTTKAELEAVLPERQDNMPAAALEVLRRMLISSRAAGRARRALNGEKTGAEFDARMAANHKANQERYAIDDMLLDYEAKEGPITL